MSFVVIFFALALANGIRSAAQLLIHTDAGPVLGTRRSGVRQFKSIPFAAHSRWMPPRRPEPWTHQFNASSRIACVGAVDCKRNSSIQCQEDCLGLDVYTPFLATNKKLPVMFFLHGGAFIEGCDDCLSGLYDGSNLSKTHHVVVVTANYRLGAFGFLAVNGTSIAGNYGIMDQRAALEWVQRNVGRFGGDPSKVTIWGESAGAMSVGVHLASQKAVGLFSGAIMESNPLAYKYRTRAEVATMIGPRFVKYFPPCQNSTSAELENCLRTQNVSSLVKASDNLLGRIVGWGDVIQNVLPWTPNVDGDELVDQILDIFEAGHQLNVPLIIGSNTIEMAFFLDYLPSLSHAEFEAAVLAIFGTYEGFRVLSQYPAKGFPNDQARSIRASTDWMFQCTSDRLAAAHLAAGNQAFVYRFNYLEPEHGFELPFVFGNYWDGLAAGGVALSKAIGEYFASFATGKRPMSSTASISWPAFNASTRGQRIVFDAGNLSTNITIEESWQVCPFWSSIPLNQRSVAKDSLFV